MTAAAEVASSQLWDEYACPSCGPLRLARATNESPVSRCPFCTSRGEGGGPELTHTRTLTSLREQRRLGAVGARLELLTRIVVGGGLEQPSVRAQVRQSLLELLVMLDQGTT